MPKKATKVIPIGEHFHAERTDTDLFLVYAGVRIAKRGYDGTPDEGTWVSLVPGWWVEDVGDLDAIDIYWHETKMH